MTLVEELAEQAHELAVGSDAASLAEAGRHVLDTIGCIVSGATHPLAARWLELLVRTSGEASTAGARALGHPGRCPLLTAVEIDATLAHLDEFDPLHTPAGVTPGALVVAPALVLGDAVGASGEAVARAIIAGEQALVETALRFGGAALYAARWWPSALFGAVGAAAAASELFGLDQAARTTALAFAASGLGGLLSDGELGHAHYLLCGMVAARGVWAALAAQAGLTASASLLDVPARAALGHDPAPAAPARRHLLDAALKPWPCARPLHAALTALDELAGDGVVVAPGDRLELLLPTALLSFVTAERRPVGPVEASVSATVAIGGVIAGRAADPAWYREVGLGETTVTGPSIELGSSRSLDAEFPDRWGAELTVISTAGRATRRTMVARGDPALPLSASALIAKAAGLTGLDPSSPVLTELLALADATDVSSALTRLRAALPRA
jgi:2-methylcitrate dehydratase PrpD